MSGLDHIADLNTRNVLGSSQPSAPDVAAALEFAEQCCQADMENPDIDWRVSGARRLAIDAARAFWDLPCVPGAVANLRLFWQL